MELTEAWEAMEKLTHCEVLTETGWERTLITAITARTDATKEGIEIRVLDPHLMYWDGDKFRTRPGVRPPLPMQGYGVVEMAIDSAVLALHLRVMLLGEGGRNNANTPD